MIRLIAMDMDGTLLNSKKKISPRTREALIRAQKAGIRLILASGRPARGLRRFAEDIGMTEYGGILVSYNGAKAVDCVTGEVLFDQSMTAGEARAVLEHLKRFEPVRPIIDHGEYMYVTDVYRQMIRLDGKDFNVMEYESRSNGYLLCEKEDLAAFVDFPVEKILTTADPEYLVSHCREMMEPFKDTLNCMFTGRFYFEFTARGIDKARALAAVLKSGGYGREELMAFGDGHNDISMVTWAGRGVAMANGVEELKARADEVTASLDEDGVALVVERLLESGQ